MPLIQLLIQKLAQRKALAGTKVNVWTIAEVVSKFTKNTPTRTHLRNKESLETRLNSTYDGLRGFLYTKPWF
jgi:CHASE3 domain sensor protein